MGKTFVQFTYFHLLNINFYLLAPSLTFLASVFGWNGIDFLLMLHELLLAKCDQYQTNFIGHTKVPLVIIPDASGP